MGAAFHFSVDWESPWGFLPEPPHAAPAAIAAGILSTEKYIAER
jgi:hypothetical protein